MAKTVVLIGTLDTKGPEIAYLRDRLQELGLSTIVIDSGILGEPLEIVPDIPHEQSATFAGSNLETMRTAGSRGQAVALMRESLKNLVSELYRTGRLDAIVSMGGAEGAVMGAAAMMVLPVGVTQGSGFPYCLRIPLLCSACWHTRHDDCSLCGGHSGIESYCMQYLRQCRRSVVWNGPAWPGSSCT